MSAHQKHEALDQSVHQLLALTMWACAASILMEVVWKHSVLPSAARSLSCIMQGMWLIQVGRAYALHPPLHASNAVILRLTQFQLRMLTTLSACI